MAGRRRMRALRRQGRGGLKCRIVPPTSQRSWIAWPRARPAPHTGIRYYLRVIGSFGDKRTEALFHDEFVREFQGIARLAKRKLEAVNAASRLDDLSVPPSHRLEKLRGDLKEFHSIRVNDQWRVIFKWVDAEPREVRIVDYH